MTAPDALPAERLAEWRKDAEKRLHDGCDKTPACDDRILILLAEVERLRETVADYERGIDWDTTCINCARLMDKNYEAFARAESAEAEVATLRATLQRAETLAEEFDRRSDLADRRSVGSHDRLSGPDYARRVAYERAASELRAALAAGRNHNKEDIK